MQTRAHLVQAVFPTSPEHSIAILITPSAIRG
jgi:hypothetical protein